MNRITKVLAYAVVAITLCAAAMNSAEARGVGAAGFHGAWHGGAMGLHGPAMGWHGPGIGWRGPAVGWRGGRGYAWSGAALGATLGFALSAPYYGYYDYGYGYPAYGYGYPAYGCYLARQWGPYGRVYIVQICE